MEKKIKIKPSKNVRALEFSFNAFDNQVVICKLVATEKVILLSGDVSHKRFLLITEIAGEKKVFYGVAEALFEYQLTSFSRIANKIGVKISFRMTEDEIFIYEDAKMDLCWKDKDYCPQLNIPNRPCSKMIRYITP